jgi:hypothetical protein
VQSRLAAKGISSKQFLLYIPLRRRYRRRSRGKPETCQNLLNCRRRIYGAHDSHPSATAGAREHVHLKNTFQKLNQGAMGFPGAIRIVPFGEYRCRGASASSICGRCGNPGAAGIRPIKSLTMSLWVWNVRRDAMDPLERWGDASPLTMSLITPVGEEGGAGEAAGSMAAAWLGAISNLPRACQLLTPPFWTFPVQADWLSATKNRNNPGSGVGPQKRRNCGLVVLFLATEEKHMQHAESYSGYSMCFLSVAKLSGSRQRQPSLHRLPRPTNCRVILHGAA